jgi:hypothetical protein
VSTEPAAAQISHRLAEGWRGAKRLAACYYERSFRAANGVHLTLTSTPPSAMATLSLAYERRLDLYRRHLDRLGAAQA